jgi:hypothetical protein
LEIKVFSFLFASEKFRKPLGSGQKIGQKIGQSKSTRRFCPMSKKKLTDTAVKSLKPTDKPYKAADGDEGGMFVAVSPTGKKVFRLAFKFQGKWQQLTLGAYPALTLVEAREKARQAKRLLAQGTIPCRNQTSRENPAQGRRNYIPFCG